LLHPQSDEKTDIIGLKMREREWLSATAKGEYRNVSSNFDVILKFERWVGRNSTRITKYILALMVHFPQYRYSIVTKSNLKVKLFITSITQQDM